MFSIIIAVAYAAMISGSLFAGGMTLGPGSGTAASDFNLHENIVGRDFYNSFKWETFQDGDPTHGRVNYVDLPTARAKNMTFATDTEFIMRPDYLSIVPSNTRGRDSNRISSYSKYRDSVVILDVQHVPDSICSVWPAFWTVTAGKWPEGGEIDIYEGVNKGEANLGSLHTSSGCTMAQERTQTGRTTSTNCYAYANHNQGCGTQFTKPASFGTSLNAIGGGWFAMERTNAGIKLWFWGRNDPTVPESVSQHNEMVSPDVSWGTPDASFPSSSTCDISKHFDEHMIVFDTTFCGDWAGSQYERSGCPGSCEEFVNNNPGAFKDAYWEINSLRIYTPSLKGSIL